MIQYLLTASVIVNYTQMVMASRILVHGRRGDIGQRVQHRADKGLDTKPESVWSGENVLEETTVHQLVTQTKHVQVGALVLQILLYLKNYLGQLVYFPFTNSSVRPLSTVCLIFYYGCPYITIRKLDWAGLPSELYSYCWCVCEYPPYRCMICTFVVFWNEIIMFLFCQINAKTRMYRGMNGK